LQGYQRLLHDHFRVDTTVGGKGALMALTVKGPYAVVVSNMRMPEMNGLQFLSR
jgi:CheY-like chemotaxis protein